MLPFFGHHDPEIARTAVRVYVMRLYRAYDIVSLDVTGSTSDECDGSRPHSPDSDIGLPSRVSDRCRSLMHPWLTAHWDSEPIPFIFIFTQTNVSSRTLHKDTSYPYVQNRVE